MKGGGVAVNRADVKPMPASPEQAATRLRDLLLAVSRARHGLTTMYTDAFLCADGPQEQRRITAQHDAADAQKALDDAQAELEAYRLLADLTRSENTR